MTVIHRAMETNLLATAVALSDRDLLARIDVLAGKERETTVELVAHLAALELRPSLYAARGYGSLFAYCTEALRLSEDAGCNRIAAARACRDFPVVLDLLASGSLTLTTVRMLRKHLTPENHEAVLARAANRTREQIEALVAELAPKPDVVASLRKLPVPRATLGPPAEVSAVATQTMPLEAPPESPSAANVGDSQDAIRPTPRPVVQALAPERYRVQFTIGQESHDKLRRVQSLLRRQIPNGDPGVIFERALDLLLEKVEKTKLGAASKPGRQAGQTGPAGRAYENRIRPGTDNEVNPVFERRKGPSRHIPSEVKRAVWWRDTGQCAFVSDEGRRCTERNFLELHHIRPYAMDGPATVGNIALRCRRHNQYEGELVFGPRRPIAPKPEERAT